LYSVKILTDEYFVLSQFTHLTDRWTDRQTDKIATAITCVAIALHAVARQKTFYVFIFKKRVLAFYFVTFFKFLKYCPKILEYHCPFLLTIVSMFTILGVFALIKLQY